MNSSFYRVPAVTAVKKWVERTPADFEFSLKLYQKFTHPDMYLARPGVAGWDLSRADVDQFRAGIEPLANAGKLAAVLMQFPPSFHASPDTRAYLEWVLQAFGEFANAVELRHRSWSDDTAGTRTRALTLSMRKRSSAWPSRCSC